MQLSKERASQVKAALLRARNLIAIKDRWTKNRERTPRHGEYAYCSIGAIKQATNMYNNDPLIVTDEPLTTQTLRFLRDVVGMDIAHFNDGANTTHEDVLRVFDRAVAEAEKQARA